MVCTEYYRFYYSPKNQLTKIINTAKTIHLIKALKLSKTWIGKKTSDPEPIQFAKTIKSKREMSCNIINNKRY